MLDDTSVSIACCGLRRSNRRLGAFALGRREEATVSTMLGGDEELDL